VLRSEKPMAAAEEAGPHGAEPAKPAYSSEAA
jgi:hypothetical protein